MAMLGPVDSAQDDRALVVLIAQVLDDLDDGRFDVAGALTSLATHAWALGYERATGLRMAGNGRSHAGDCGA